MIEQQGAKPCKHGLQYACIACNPQPGSRVIREEDEPRYQGSDDDVFVQADIVIYDQAAGEEMAARIEKLERLIIEIHQAATAAAKLSNIVISDF